MCAYSTNRRIAAFRSASRKSLQIVSFAVISTAGTLAAMALQIPIGALVDHVPAKRLLAAVAVAAISGSALLLALWPIFDVVLNAKTVRGSIVGTRKEVQGFGFNVVTFPVLYDVSLTR